MHTFYVGNPISLILGYSYGNANSVYYLIKEDQDLRESNRNTLLALELQESIAIFFDLNYYKISFDEFEKVYRSENEFVTEFRFVSYFYRKFGELNLSRIQAISYGADLLLAGARLFDMMRGPRNFRIIYAWKRELRKYSTLKNFLMPELSNNLRKISNISIKIINRVQLLKNLRLFAKSEEFAQFIGIKNLEKKSLVIVGPDYYGFDMKNVDNLLAKIKSTPGLANYQILLKPHPASNLLPEMIEYFEINLGRQTLNSIHRLDLNRVKTIPLEVFMASNDSNLYFGVYTAGVSMSTKKRVKWVPSSDSFAEKLYKINYRSFISHWSK